MGLLLTEQLEDCGYLVEDIGGVKNHYIQGIMLQAERENKNHRSYPKELLDREVGRYNTNYIRTNRAWGELGHPTNPTINLPLVSHIMVELYPDGTDYYGKAKILDTPMGNIVKSLLEGGGQLGVSTRGVGSLKNIGGVQQVQPDFHLSCIDIVADPSAPDAFVQGLMENHEWIMEHGQWKEREYYEAKKAIKEANRADVETIALRLFENYMSKLTKL